MTRIMHLILRHRRCIVAMHNRNGFISDASVLVIENKLAETLCHTYPTECKYDKARMGLLANRVCLSALLDVLQEA